MIRRSRDEVTSHATAAPDGIRARQCIVGNEAERVDGEEGWRMTAGSGPYRMFFSQTCSVSLRRLKGTSTDLL